MKWRNKKDALLLERFRSALLEYRAGTFSHAQIVYRLHNLIDLVAASSGSSDVGYQRVMRVLRRLEQDPKPTGVAQIITLLPDYADAAFFNVATVEYTTSNLTATKRACAALERGTHKPSRKHGMTK